MEYIEFGKIVNTHGIKGEVKIYSYTDDPDNILKLKNVYIDSVKYDVEKIRYVSNMFVIKIKGIDRIEDTECIMNKEIKREVSDKEFENDNEFFVRDLIGIEVFDESDIYIGKLKQVLNTGANDVYVINRENKEELLLPAIAQVVKQIDIKKRKMTVCIMEGLDK